MTDEPPQHFVCSITYEIMRDPVVDREGNSYERSAISHWLSTNSTSPITRQPLRASDLTPNRALKDAIDMYLAAEAARAEAAAAAAKKKREEEEERERAEAEQRRLAAEQEMANKRKREGPLAEVTQQERPAVATSTQILGSRLTVASTSSFSSSTSSAAAAAAAAQTDDRDDVVEPSRTEVAFQKAKDAAKSAAAAVGSAASFVASYVTGK